VLGITIPCMQKTTAFTAAGFGLVVKKYRNKRNMTQESLAAACDLHVVYISMLETGKRHPTLDKVFLIAWALGVKAETLVAEVSRALDNKGKKSH